MDLFTVLLVVVIVEVIVSYVVRRELKNVGSQLESLDREKSGEFEKKLYSLEKQLRRLNLSWIKFWRIKKEPCHNLGFVVVSD